MEVKYIGYKKVFFMHDKVKIGISSNALKNIAAVSMVCDHIGYRLIEHGLLKDYDLSQDIVRLLWCSRLPL